MFHPASFFLKPKADPPLGVVKNGPHPSCPQVPMGCAGPSRPALAALFLLCCAVCPSSPPLFNLAIVNLSAPGWGRMVPPPLYAEAPKHRGGWVLMAVTYQNRGAWATLVVGGGVWCQSSLPTEGVNRRVLIPSGRGRRVGVRRSIGAPDRAMDRPTARDYHRPAPKGGSTNATRRSWCNCGALLVSMSVS